MNLEKLVEIQKALDDYKKNVHAEQRAVEGLKECKRDIKHIMVLLNKFLNKVSWVDEKTVPVEGNANTVYQKMLYDTVKALAKSKGLYMKDVAIGIGVAENTFYNWRYHNFNWRANHLLVGLVEKYLVDNGYDIQEIKTKAGV